MKIFLDDDPYRDSWVDDTWTIVRTAENGRVTTIHLDNEREWRMSRREKNG